MQQQQSWKSAASSPLHIVLSAEVCEQLHEEQMRTAINALTDDILQLPEATACCTPAWTVASLFTVAIFANVVGAAPRVVFSGSSAVVAASSLPPPAAACPSSSASPWPVTSPEAFALHLRHWRSDGRDTLCCSSSLEAGDSEEQAKEKAPWLHNVTPTLYDDSFIKVRDCTFYYVLQELRSIEKKHFPSGGVYTHATWMEDVYRDEWIIFALYSQVALIALCLFFFLSLLLSPMGAAVVSALLLLQAVFVGGLLVLCEVPFDVVTLIVRHAHASVLDQLAWRQAPSASSLASSSMQGLLIRGLPVSLHSAPPSPPHQSYRLQQQQNHSVLCSNCGEPPEACVVQGSPTAATVEVLLAGLHRQRHQAPLLAFLATREAAPSILMSAVSTLLGKRRRLLSGAQHPPLPSPYPENREYSPS
ncbi:cholesterol transporter related protein with 12 transmembrane domain [Cyclospora cayetanensis]|uniref:Cholesterol transporter related protein with 12 transmembrane domain n=1 Tax=Cyclospora cayetanensis TaxID=88456 RepID=A0A1D3CUU4_9EIME|nr:cholesterol transporter related protein with 12 transmembrane domain [Cyclospora cayetanensis]